jgi:Gpi18-like mannosyltransferase
MSTLTAAVTPLRASITRLAWRADSSRGLAVLFAAGLLIRLLIAPHAGYYADLKIFQAWAVRLAEVGPDDFYLAQWVDYPPGYLYVLWLLGKIAAPPGYVLLKMPAILGDLALAWVAGTFARRLAPGLAERVPLRALVSAAVLFNPAMIMDSTVWGQVDVIPAVLVLASLMLLFTGTRSLTTETAAFVLLGLAAATKPQSAFVVPVMLYALCRRHLRKALWEGRLRHLLRVVVPPAASIGVWLLTALPFGFGAVGLLKFYRGAASEYEVTSAFAFNLWGSVAFLRPDSPAVTTIDGVPVKGGAVELFFIPALHLGTVLLAVGALVILWSAHRAIQRGAGEALVLTVAAAATSLLAFTVLTRMHERYMFYALAFLAPLIFIRPVRIVYGVLSGLFFLNLWWVYAYNNSRGDLGHECSLPFPGCVGVDPLLGGFAIDAWQKKVYSATVVAIALALAWLGSRWAARQRERVPSVK